MEACVRRPYAVATRPLIRNLAGVRDSDIKYDLVSSTLCNDRMEGLDRASLDCLYNVQGEQELVQRGVY
jgi:hypothetical protein